MKIEEAIEYALKNYAKGDSPHQTEHMVLKAFALIIKALCVKTNIDYKKILTGILQPEDFNEPEVPQ